MDMKGIQKKVGLLQSNAWNHFSEILVRPWITRICAYIMRFAVGFVLSQALILGGYSPFGLGYVAALGGGRGALIGLAGSLLGYFSILHKANGLKYVAICVLIYTASFVFKETPLCKKSWFMPLAALISTACIGFVFVADAGFVINDVVFYLTEIALTTACAYFYQLFFNIHIAKKSKDQLRKSVGTIVLLATLVVPLSQTTFWGAVSVGRILSVLFIMLAGYYGGAGLGSCAGIAFGLAVGVTSGTSNFCAVYGFCGLFAGVFRNFGKLIFTVVYVLSNAAVMMWVSAGSHLGLLYETFFAAVFFMLVSEFFADRVKSFVTVQSEPVQSGYAARVRTFASDRLTKASAAFQDLSEMLGNSFRRSPHDNDGNIACVFDAPAQHICRKCTLSNSCWEREYITTRDALNSVTKTMQEQGSVQASDFPIHFSSRCIKFEQFVAAINQELAKYLYRKQFNARITESRNMVCKQYSEMSSIFNNMANELQDDPCFDERAEARLRELLNLRDVIGEPCVYRDMSNHIHVEIEGKDLALLSEDLTAFHSEASQAIGIQLTEPIRICDSGREQITMRQLEPLCATIGVAVHKKRDSDISGDSGSYFKLDDGTLCVILSDGMGSGKSAAVMSASAISILERFLKSGIDAKTAISTINSALILKGEETGGFTTLDFMQVNLYSGDTNFFKLGSAPSYIKRGNQIRKITSMSLPAGVPCINSQIDSSRIKLHYGDFVVIATDGIIDPNDDSWLETMISEYSGESAKQLAGDILTGACAKYGRTDDMTVMVIRLVKNV